jgi:hypothetical protein
VLRLSSTAMTALRISLVAVGLWVAFAPEPVRAQPADSTAQGRECKVDADCGDPYLVCNATLVFIDECFRIDAGLDAPSDAGACRTSVEAMRNLCAPSYQVPCRVDSDCGPDGFTCNLDGGRICSADAGCETYGRCESDETLCSSDAECPEGWSCYAPTSHCFGGDCDVDAGIRKACYPPFTVFRGASESGHGADAGVSRARKHPTEQPSSGCSLSAGRGNSTYSIWFFGLALAWRRLRKRARRTKLPRSILVLAALSALGGCGDDDSNTGADDSGALSHDAAIVPARNSGDGGDAAIVTAANSGHLGDAAVDAAIVPVGKLGPRWRRSDRRRHRLLQSRTLSGRTWIPAEHGRPGAPAARLLARMRDAGGLFQGGDLRARLR